MAEYSNKDDPGKIRHLTLDARISRLGGKEPPRRNDPLRIRQGIETAKQERAEKRVREAKEAGIVMPVKRKAKAEKVRERGLNMTNGIGKFKKGMLKVNAREIQRINKTESNITRRKGGIKKLFK